MPEVSFNLQDKIFNQARIKQYPIKINLLNKNVITGKIDGFDRFTIVLNKNGEQELIFKHAISSISPVSPIKILLPKPTPGRAGRRESSSQSE